MSRHALLFAAVLACAGTRGEARAGILGTAETFAVLGGTTVTNTGPSVITGDVGVSPGTSVTGFPPGTVIGGTIHTNDAVAIQAQIDAAAAFVALAAFPFGTDLTGQDLGGLTLTPGTYSFSSSAQLTGTLTLDGQGQSDPLFIFQIGSTLTTASNSSVVLINGADPCDIYFQVGSSATLGTGTSFAGNIIALTSDTLSTGSTVDGRVIALNGAVTLDSNIITRPVCTTAAVPEPSSVALLASALTPLLALRRRIRTTTRPPGGADMTA